MRQARWVMAVVMVALGCGGGSIPTESGQEVGVDASGSVGSPAEVQLTLPAESVTSLRLQVSGGV